MVETAGHSTPGEWLIAGGVALLLLVPVLWLLATGDAGERRGLLAPAARLASSLERVTGLPAWSAGGVLLHRWAIVSAGLGFFWDVAWHIDLGRDSELLTPAHTLILLGLVGIGAAGLVGIGLATLAGAPTGWRVGRLRVPRGAAGLVALGAGATAGFPLDDLWHANYGIDVTMWGPTHLLMIGGAALSPLPAWMLLSEAGRPARMPWIGRQLWGMLAVMLLLALSAFQLEFDDGVPQWQALYQPVLIAVGATLPMVAARVALGRHGALKATAGFLAVRGVVALVLGPGLGHVVPRIPLYVGIAACVEAGFALARRRPLLDAALAAGGLAGTAGLAVEWGMSHLWGREPWQPRLLGTIWVASLAAVAAAVVGVAVGAAVARRGRAVPPLALVLACAGVVIALAVPLPRHGIGALATIHTSPAGPAQPVVDRFGRASVAREVNVEVEVSDPEAVRGADWFWVLSWQGGGRSAADLVERSPGHWQAAGSVPTGGSWKSIVLLARGDVVAAAPVAMPADPEGGRPAIPVLPVRTARLDPASLLLMREAHGGAAWPAAVAYSALLGITLGWVGLLAAAIISLGRGVGPHGFGADAGGVPSRRRRTTGASLWSSFSSGPVRPSTIEKSGDPRHVRNNQEAGP